ncbi:MAG: YdhK family protein [Candidatus Pristimantibacillus lignocellulolyticus]|uniref:YdhK family protein n=1 Tax=Candidatus Pristimantibacillus lignocellulolyticus TaxID=2994561 RepID=A0A9J6Z9A0_9BACL|nr:MAG: YdhK family protein [Candidatus Pristimantibacillus lignocellulolyticus]
MKKIFVILSVAMMIALSISACGNNTAVNSSHHGNMDMGDMDHSGSGIVPTGLKEAKNPTYKVGEQVTLQTDHMKGMDGAKATIVGAYDTTVYEVSYTPTTGGQEVKNHKWVIQEEIKDHKAEPYKPGDQVILETDHMKGMNGATATIDTATQTTVYMVDYTPTSGGEIVKNHQWVTESEITK